MKEVLMAQKAKVSLKMLPASSLPVQLILGAIIFSWLDLQLPLCIIIFLVNRCLRFLYLTDATSNITQLA